MKKLLQSLAILTCFVNLSYGQLLIPSVEVEHTVPPPAFMERSCQVHSYSMEEVSMPGVGPNNLYLTSWSGSATAGIYYRRAIPVSTSPFNEITDDDGYIELSNPYGSADFRWIDNLNAVFIQEGARVYVAATFYGFPSYLSSVPQGFYLNIYEWTPTGFILVSNTLLSPHPVMERISMDAHRLYGCAIVWSESGVLRTKMISTYGGSVNIGPDVTLPSTYSGYIPDIAFSHKDELMVNYVYVDQATLNIHLIRGKFDDLLLGGSGSLTLLDVNVDPFSASFNFGYTYTDPLYVFSLNSTALSLDCPDHSPEDIWAYIYTTEHTYSSSGANIKLRKYAPPTLAFPHTVVLSVGPTSGAGIENNNVTINTNRNGRIYTGWRITGLIPSSPTSIFISKTISYTTTAVSTPYYIISSTLNAFSDIAFSKQDDRSTNIFASYLDQGPYSVKYKLKPYSTGGAFSEIISQKEGGVISIYPNPSIGDIKISYDGNINEEFEVRAVNMIGQVVFDFKSRYSNLESEINKRLQSTGAGVYNLIFNSQSGNKQVIKLSKQ